MKILVTGGRDWTDQETIRFALCEIHDTYSSPFTLIHGACDGADTLAARIAKDMGWSIEAYPVTNAQWLALGKKAGPIRNAAMVALQPNVVLAFPTKSSRTHGGTWDCVDKALAAGLVVTVYSPLKHVSK